MRHAWIRFTRGGEAKGAMHGSDLLGVEKLKAPCMDQIY